MWQNLSLHTTDRMESDHSDPNFQPSGRRDREENNSRGKQDFHKSSQIGGLRNNSGSGSGYQSDGWQDPKPNVRFQQDGYFSDSREDNRSNTRFQQGGYKTNNWQENNYKRFPKDGNSSNWQGRKNQNSKPYNNSPQYRGPDEARFHSDGRNQYGYNQSGQRTQQDRRDSHNSMPDQVRDYLNSFMKDINRSY